MPHLDYTAVTNGGRAFDMRFPLHPETTSQDQVARMLTQTLARQRSSMMPATSPPPANVNRAGMRPIP